MPYTKTSWVANVTPVTAASMNNIETGIVNHDLPVGVYTMGAGQVITNAVGVNLLLTVTESLSDPRSVFSLNTGTGVVTVNETGWYLINGMCNYTGGGAGALRLVLVYGAGNELARANAGPLATNPSASSVFRLTAGQTVYMQAYHDDTAARTVSLGRMSIVQLMS